MQTAEWGALVVSFSIFHVTFVIYHCAPSAVPAMINDKRNMENGKSKYE
jgi:hypothetical protein